MLFLPACFHILWFSFPWFLIWFILLCTILFSALIFLLPPFAALRLCSAPASPIFSSPTSLLSSLLSLEGWLSPVSCWQLHPGSGSVCAFNLWNPVSSFVSLNIKLMQCRVHSWLLLGPMLNTRDRQNVLSGMTRNLESCFRNFQRFCLTVLWLCPFASNLLCVCVNFWCSVCACLLLLLRLFLRMPRCFDTCCQRLVYLQSMTKFIFKNPGTSKSNQRKKTNPQVGKRNTNTGTRARSQHSQSAFLKIPDTRFQVSDHPRKASLPLSLSSHWTANGSAVHCELHYWRVVGKQPTHWWTKIEPNPGPWRTIPVSPPRSKCNEQATLGSRKQQQQTAEKRAEK